VALGACALEGVGLAMRVLLTGNQGYIGTVLAPMLRGAGHDVVGLDNGLFRECSIAPVPDVPALHKDIRDVEPKDLEGFEAVIHLAGLSNDPLGDLNPALTFDINHLASVRLATLARSVGVGRFLYASTCSVYGAAGDAFLDEGSAFNPVTPYAESKMRTEQDLLHMADERFTPVYLRAATAYGASPLLRFDLAVNNLVAWATTTGLVFLKSLGTSWRPLVHVEDIARAYVALLHAPREVVHNRAFNVGRTDQNYRIRDVAELIREIVPETRVEYADDACADQRNYRVNCDRLVELLPASRPRWTVAEGALEVYQTIKAGGLRSQDFEGPRYNRIAYLRQLLSDRRVGSDLRWREPQPAHVGPVAGEPVMVAS
jgi:nucleoside-diphosphate-sugar epimerase